MRAGAIEQLWRPKKKLGRPPKDRNQAQAAISEAIAAGRLPKTKTELRVIPEKELGRILNTKPDTVGRVRDEYLKYFKELDQKQ